MVRQLKQENNQKLGLDRLQSIEDSDILPNENRLMITAGWMIIFSLVLGIGVASQTKYKVTVKAAATIQPIGNTRTVQSGIDGTVNQIFVQEGEYVKKGQPIASLNPEQLDNKKAELENNIQSTKSQLIRVDSQISENNQQLIAQGQKNSSSWSFAESELELAQRRLNDKTITSQSEVNKVKANINNAQDRLKEQKVQLNMAKLELERKEAELQSANKKLKRLQPVADEGGLILERLEEVELKVETGKKDVAIAKENISSRQKRVDAVNQEIKALTAELERVQANLNPSSAEVQMARQKIQTIKADGQRSVAQLKQEVEALIQQKEELNKELNTKQKELAKINLEKSKTIIIAPEEGYIFRLKLRNIDQKLRYGEQVTQIVPSSASIEIQGAVTPQDINKVKVGQQVNMRVTACPYPDFGTLEGKVTQISSNTIKPENNGSNHLNHKSKEKVNAFYDVKIKPLALSLGKQNNQCPLQIGMEGRADIISRQETLLQFLLRKARLITDL